MDPTVFVLLTALSAVGLYVGATCLSRSGEKPSSTAAARSEKTRWRRYLLHPRALDDDEAGSFVVEAEASRERLRLLEPARNASWDIADADRRRVLRVKRGALRRVLKLRVENEPWIELGLGGGNRFPELRPLEPPGGDLPPARNLDLHGDHRAREFEVRLAGRLVASVSWQRDDGDDGPRRSYVVEIVKSAPALPILGLVVSLEIAAQLEGLPAVDGGAGAAVTSPAPPC